MSNDTKGQMESILMELGKKIDQLIAEAKVAGSELRDDMEVKIEELRKRKEKLEEDFKEYKSDERWAQARAHLVSAAGELRQAAEKIFHSKKA